MKPFGSKSAIVLEWCTRIAKCRARPFCLPALPALPAPLPCSACFSTSYAQSQFVLCASQRPSLSCGKSSVLLLTTPREGGSRCETSTVYQDPTDNDDLTDDEHPACSKHLDAQRLQQPTTPTSAHRSTDKRINIESHIHEHEKTDCRNHAQTLMIQRASHRFP